MHDARRDADGRRAQAAVRHARVMKLGGDDFAFFADVSQGDGNGTATIGEKAAVALNNLALAEADARLHLHGEHIAVSAQWILWLILTNDDGVAARCSCLVHHFEQSLAMVEKILEGYDSGMHTCGGMLLNLYGQGNAHYLAGGGSGWRRLRTAAGFHCACAVAADVRSAVNDASCLHGDVIQRIMEKVNDSLTSCKLFRKAHSCRATNRQDQDMSRRLVGLLRLEQSCFLHHNP